uniref:40S ribosomal protein S24 n=1 Tax=Amorphochlora amoebiformis TaxID=1561963 RepID=A0A7S0DQ43_9EUKA|mmetsp:Transcript_5337/g.8093  ORF Transcript_5337/g.8093 Transcript_5337/m.8093 type:complete len:131 (+) Transcript_5337:26-418(+)
MPRRPCVCKFMQNRLLNRKQMILDVLHPGRGPVPRKELRDILCKKFGVKNNKCVFVFGFKTAFGGARSTGFALIYDTLNDALNVEPKYRLIRNELGKKATGSRKSRKELKNKKKKFRGIKKAKVGAAGGG